jgi:hypothetical protein
MVVGTVSRGDGRWGASYCNSRPHRRQKIRVMERDARIGRATSALAAAIAANNAPTGVLAADVARRQASSLVARRRNLLAVSGPGPATLIATDGEVRPHATELVATGVIGEASAGTALAPAGRVLAVSARRGQRPRRGAPQERPGEQRAPGGAPRSRSSQEPSETIEGLVVHRLVLRPDVGCGTGCRCRKWAGPPCADGRGSLRRATSASHV